MSSKSDIATWYDTDRRKKSCHQKHKNIFYPVLGFSVIKYFHIIDPHWSWVQSLEMRKSTVNK